MERFDKLIKDKATYITLYILMYCTVIQLLGGRVGGRFEDRCLFCRVLGLGLGTRFTDRLLTGID